MPCPHFDVKIIQRSKRQSAVASAAYQSGERLFSEYDQKQKYYKAALLEALEQAKEPTIPELLSRYLDMRSEERTGWTSKGKLKGTVGDFNKVMEALDFLRQKEISTVESLDAYLDKVSGEILSAKTDIRKSERRIKAIDTTLSHIANHGAYKEVYKKYASIG